MLKISKNEAMMLQDLGFRWGETIFTTHSKYHHYFCCAAPKVVKALKNYNEKIKIK